MEAMTCCGSPGLNDSTVNSGGFSALRSERLTAEYKLSVDAKGKTVAHLAAVLNTLDVRFVQTARRQLRQSPPGASRHFVNDLSMHLSTLVSLLGLLAQQRHRLSWPIEFPSALQDTNAMGQGSNPIPNLKRQSKCPRLQQQ
jgi:hypothetical protein